ncbi:MAG TPA: hypothetical protein VFB27_14280 [Opitutaceae bacterium]|nr:hypothetical protein [Opitutaceae bacterium]
MKNVPWLLIVLLAGCASSPRPSEDYHGPLTQVHDTAIAISSSETYFCRLVRIDDQPVQENSGGEANQASASGAVQGRLPAAHSVPARSCVLTIEGVDEDRRDTMGRVFGMPRVRGEITANLADNQQYFIRGKISEHGMIVWLEDGSGHTVGRPLWSDAGIRGTDKIPRQGISADPEPQPVPNLNQN